MTPGSVLVRIASLSLARSQELCRSGTFDDPLVWAALSLGADRRIVDKRQLDHRARATIERYVTRMGGRATPNGLFAGVALATLGTHTDLRLGDANHHKVSVRVDVSALKTVVEAAYANAKGAVDLIWPCREPIAVARDLLDAVGDDARAEVLRDLAKALRIEPPGAVFGLGERVDEAWRRASRRAPELVDWPTNRRVHTDLYMHLEAAQVSAQTVDQLDETVRRMQLIFPALDELEDFKRRFEQRYEDNEVPLTEALAPEAGLWNFAELSRSPLAQAAGIESAPQTSSASSVTELFERSCGRLEPIDISDLPMAGQRDFASIHAVLIGPGSSSEAMINVGSRRVAHAMTARFGFGRPSRRESGTRTVEIVHWPGDKEGNILLRPRLADEVLAFAGGGGGTITPGDMLLRLEHNELRLRDRRSGRALEVVLHSSDDVQLPGLDPTYRFLGMLACRRPLRWSWTALGNVRHFPRVTCGAVIAAPECWRVTGDALSSILKSDSARHSLRMRLDGLGERHWVGVANGDQIMPIDVTDAESVRRGLWPFRQRRSVHLVELPHVEHPAVSASDGAHVAEVVVPLRDPADRATPRPRDTASQHLVIRRQAADRSDWLYARIYCGVATADDLLRPMEALAGRLKARGHISGWFFIRYSDSIGPHIRYRLQPRTAEGRREALVELDERLASLRHAGTVQRYAFDEYVPEVARYGGRELLALAEEVFCSDSEATARFVAEQPSEPTRLYQCVRTILRWSAIAADSPDQQRIFIRGCRDGLYLQVRSAGKPVGHLYRRHRQALSDFLAADDEFASVDVAIERWARCVEVERPAESLLGRILKSLLHMHCNRVFRCDNRRLEYLAHDFAQRKLLEYRNRKSQEERSDDLIAQGSLVHTG